MNITKLRAKSSRARHRTPRTPSCAPSALTDGGLRDGGLPVTSSGWYWKFQPLGTVRCAAAGLVLMGCNGVLLQRCRDEEMCFTTVEYMYEHTLSPRVGCR